MKKALHFILDFLLSVVCFGALILGGAENTDGSCDIKWTLGCIAVATVSAIILIAINPKSVTAKTEDHE